MTRLFGKNQGPFSNIQTAGLNVEQGEKTVNALVSTQTKLLFVCTGNICRSPTAEAVALHMIAKYGWHDRFIVDSAGTHNHHAGDIPDPRSIAHAAKRGYDLSTLKARRIDTSDFMRFDFIFALDHNHLRHLHAVRSSGFRSEKGVITLITCASERFQQQSVADPYYGGPEGFEETLDMIEESLEKLFAMLLRGDSPADFVLPP